MYNRLLQVDQTSLTLSLTSVWELSALFGLDGALLNLRTIWALSGFLGLDGAVLNLRTRILQHGNNNRCSTPKIKGAATSQPNNCKKFQVRFLLRNKREKIKQKASKRKTSRYLGNCVFRSAKGYPSVLPTNRRIPMYPRFLLYRFQ